MKSAVKCLKVKDALILFIDSIVGFNFNGLKPDEDICFYFTDYGILIKIKDEISIPLPEILFEFISENSTIHLYEFFSENYIEEIPLYSFRIEKESFLQIKGAYKYWKQSNENSQMDREKQKENIAEEITNDNAKDIIEEDKEN